MLKLPPDRLRRFTQQVFEACSAPAAEAAIVADHLVKANLVGVDSHGVMRVPQYVRDIHDGGIIPGAHLQVSQETETTAIADGGWNFGPVVAQRAVELAIEKARAHHVAFVVTRRCGHAGRLGHYTEHAAEKGFFAFGVCNSPRHGHFVLPWGGREPRLATNPLSYAVPTGFGSQVLADFSTSTAPEGKVRLYRDKNESLPEGWIVDHEGNPSTNPQDFYGPPMGALLPFGGSAGYRGYALGLLVEILGGTLSAQRITVDQSGNGVAFLVLDVSAFLPREEFYERVHELRDYIESSPPAEGFERVMLPGEPELLRQQERQREGIPVDEAVWAEVLRAGESVGVAWQA